LLSIEFYFVSNKNKNQFEILEYFWTRVTLLTVQIRTYCQYSITVCISTTTQQDKKENMTSSAVNNTSGQWCISPRSNALVATVVNHHTFTVEGRYSFPLNKILGVGSYGVVAASYDETRKENIAIKRVRPYAEDEIYAKLSLRELRCLKLLGTHPNVFFKCIYIS